ncbi:L-fucose:H+ symporter permease [Paramuribaculum intestinale]|uniref:L-fucose:H+ symporter permease n=1 Tax=Paramuribaculum intestinale TaxID=2094151 RepID=UPI0025B18D97|nr:L-fucose:H+ symporter permease [Paramuribaculum intestinale]
MNNDPKTAGRKRPPLVPRRYLLTFILITSLFALWGFANDITNPMVAAFQTVMELSAAKASMVQFAFYGGYATMAIPAALFIRRYSYKTGILIGLGLYAVGAFLFIPAANLQQFSFFCVSLYVLTFGLAFLETTANPYILSLGSPDNATRRLNLAQAFNPVGSLSGMAIASLIVLPNLLSDRRDDAGQIIFPALDAAEKASIRTHDLAVIRDPYVAIGLVVLIMFVVIACVKMPGKNDDKAPLAFRHTLKKLWDNVDYRLGVITQVFYVAAQIMVWTFIIQYADNLGIDKATAQNYNIGAMALSLTFRFVGTFFMRYIRPAKLLAIFGIGASLCTLGTILIEGYAGLIFLVAISAFMSIMFPSIYGIALGRVDHDDTSLGAAFLVMAIVGGALMPPLQGSIIDLGHIGPMAAVNVSFCLPLICFIVVTCYGLRTMRRPEHA